MVKRRPPLPTRDVASFPGYYGIVTSPDQGPVVTGPYTTADAAVSASEDVGSGVTYTVVKGTLTVDEVINVYRLDEDDTGETTA